VTKRTARITVAIGFLVSRVAFHLSGVRFDTSPLPWFWQYLDPPLLRSDLASSLWYLHAQPPLFNAFLGLGLKVGGSHAALLFHFSYVAIGLGIALTLHDLLGRVGLGRRMAIAVTLLYVASPTSMLYEKWLMYTQIETGALMLAAWSLARLCERGGWRQAAPYFGAVAALALTRSLFHPVWVAACVAIAFVAMRPLRRPVVVGGVCALAVVGGLYAKNDWLFGIPAASSWFGMNLANMVLDRWPLDERELLVEQGVVSPLLLQAPFSPLDAYPESFRSTEGPDVPALRSPFKASGEANYNHIAYIAISRLYQRDALTLIRRDPARYAAVVASAWQKYLLAPSNYAFVEPNRRRILAWNRIYDALYGVPTAWTGAQPGIDDPLAPPSLRRLCWLWIALCVPSVGYAAIVVGRAVFGTRRPDAAAEHDAAIARRALIAFCLLTVAFVSLAANAVELGENNRFRVPIEPLLILLVAFAARRLASRISRVRAAAR